jgi:multiple sugar transport system ATP-binding protein
MLEIDQLTFRYDLLDRKPSLLSRLTNRSISKCPEPRAVLHKLNLEVRENELLVVLGPSGSGKTTLLRCIAGLIRTDSGAITINGEDVTQKAAHQRGVSFVFQQGGWYDHLTVEQNLKLDGATSKEVDSWLERIGLTEFRRMYPGELSGGQAQRLAIGRAIAKGNSLILLDEPLNQMDEALRELFRELIRELHREGRTLVYVTHDQFDAMQLATRIAILHNGQVQQTGTIEELYRVPNHLSVALALGQPRMQFFEIAIARQDSGYDLIEIEENFDAARISFSKQPHRGPIVIKESAKAIVGIRPEAWQSTRLEDMRVPELGRMRIARCLTHRFFGDKAIQTWSWERKGFPNIEIQRLVSVDEDPPDPASRYTLGACAEQWHFFDLESGERCTPAS